jgi:hypothetical protein
MKMKLIQIIVCSILFFSQAQGQDGYDKTYLLIRCDDMGMCHSVNEAMEQIMKAGIPISTSVMFACPWYQEAVEILKKYPQVGVGIHLTLNAEWKNYRWGPVLGKKAVPTLVDSVGYFFPSRSLLFANNPKTSEIEMELRAQIERALNSGIRIDYIDYHMGAAVQTKELRDLVESLAEEYGLGMSGYFNEKYSSITYNAPLEEKADSLFAHLHKLTPGVNLQVMHVGIDDNELSSLKDLNEFGLKNMSAHRQEELNSLLEIDLEELKENGIELITYKQLIEMIGLENMYRPEDSE